METINDFYDTLTKLPKCYEWTVENKSIIATKTRGVAKGVTFNPVTAVAHKLGVGNFSNNKNGTLEAGSALGLPRRFTSSVYDAVKGRFNRGNTQVLRGRILSKINMGN